MIPNRNIKSTEKGNTKKEDCRNTYQAMSSDATTSGPRSGPDVTSVQQKKNRFEMVPDTATCEGNTTVVLLFDDVVAGRDADAVQVSIEENEKTESVSTKRINSRSFYFVAPEHREGTVSVKVFLSKTELGSSFLQYRSETVNVVTGLTQLYIHFMSQMCQFVYSLQKRNADPNPLSKLDDLLAGAFDVNKGVRHVPAVAFEELFGVNRHLAAATGSSPYEMPTLLHFASQFGLQNLSVALMDIPGAEQAGAMVNARGKTPCQIARDSGYNDLARSLSKSNPASDYDHPTVFIRGDSEIIKSRSNDRVETQYPSEKRDSPIYMRPDPEKVPTYQDDTYAILTTDETNSKSSRQSSGRTSTSKPAPAPAPCAKLIQHSSSFSKSSAANQSGYDVPPPPVPVRVSRDSGAYTDFPNTTSSSSRRPTLGQLRSQTDPNSETLYPPLSGPRRQSHDTAASASAGPGQPSGRISESSIKIKAQLLQPVPLGSGRPGPSVTK